jgi:hypothetical protein
MRRRVPCEQQLNMGQSALSGAAKAVRKSWILTLLYEARNSAKGNRVNIPEPRHGESSFGCKSGNANELGDVGQSPGESCLFFVRKRVPGIGSPGDRDVVSVKHRGSCGVQSALVGP